MDWIKLYFSNRRYKIVLHATYVLMCTLLTAKILGCFGIGYHFPKKIELPDVLNFILTGDILMPLFTFILVFGLFNMVNRGFNSLLYRTISSKIPLFKGLGQFVTSIAFHLKWFRWVDGKYEMMNNYGKFTAILDSFEGVPLNIMDFAGRFNSVVLSSWLCLLLCSHGGALQTFYLIAGALFYVFHVMNLLFLREVKSNIDFFRDIREEIDLGENDLAAVDHPNKAPDNSKL
jgi:hypothetical protein